jgi:hypothetical protein
LLCLTLSFTIGTDHTCRYAHQYGCYDAFLYDGSTYLGLLFPCASRNEIRTCNMKVWVLSLYSAEPNVTVRRCLYSQIRNAYRRLKGAQAGNGRVVLGYQLRRVPWSGQSHWFNLGTQTITPFHPLLAKSYDPVNHRWVWRDSTGVIHHYEENAL